MTRLLETNVTINLPSLSAAVDCRAPVEPYYGRYIGPFTEFAHGITVSWPLWSADDAD